MQFETPQDVEDAYYDALEAGDLQAMAGIWDASDDAVCLLPMTPLVTGPQIQRLWQAIFEQGGKFDIQVRHLMWIAGEEVAIHLVEERSGQDQPEGQALPPIYATNVFRRGPDGWRLLLHQNSPTPPPPPAVPTSGDSALA